MLREFPDSMISNTLHDLADLRVRTRAVSGGKWLIATSSATFDDMYQDGIDVAPLLFPPYQ